MSDFVFALTTGLSQGALYGLLAVAIVLPWRVSNVAPFSQGNLGMFAAFLALFTIGSALGAVVAALVAVLFGALIGGAAYVVLVAVSPSARESESGHINLTLRTFGFDVVILAVAGIFWAGSEPYKFPALVPDRAIHFLGIRTSPSVLVVLAVVLLGVTILHILFARSTIGLRLQAVAENPAHAELVGVSPFRVSFIAWVAAGGMAAMAAVLYTPFTYLTTGMMAAFLLKAFAAILIGGRESWFGVLAGGLILGVLEALLGNYTSYLWTPALAFVVITVVLVFRPQGLFARVSAQRV